MSTLKEFMTSRKLSRLFSLLLASAAFFSPLNGLAENEDPRYVGEMHAPVTVSVEEKKMEVFFLRSNFKSQISPYVSDGEIYYFQFQPLQSELRYVWGVSGEEIISVFFHETTFGEKRRSLYLLTRDRISDKEREGYSYSAMELLISSNDDRLGLHYLEKDGEDPKLQNCFDGVDLVLSKKVRCDYKNASAVKNYLQGRRW